jgi:hypothetical protein
MPPTVAAVRVSSSAWASSFLAAVDPGRGVGYSIPVGSGTQLQTLPWTNIDQIKVTFSENVTVAQVDLKISGVNLGNYSFKPDLPDGSPNDGFAYDPTTFTATWTLTQPIDTDKLILRLNADGTDPIVDGMGLRLDGEWTNPTGTAQLGTSVYPSGNGTPGGDFLFRFNVLPGDVDQSGKVILADYSAVLSRNNAVAGNPNYGIFYDVDGSGKIASADGSAVLSRKNQLLPIADPTPPASFLARSAISPTLPAQSRAPSKTQLIDLCFAAYSPSMGAADDMLQLLDPIASAWIAVRR